MPDGEQIVNSFEAIEFWECRTVAEFDACIELQRAVFGLPDLEISPRRHLIVSRRAGGWTLGAFYRNELIGFVHQLAAVRGRSEIIAYSHMMAVKREYQDRGVGARLKWMQRMKNIDEGKTFITWTWDPMQARNAHFNLNRLGVVARSFGANFYGPDYSTHGDAGAAPSARVIDSDRIFADWELLDERVRALSEGRKPAALGAPELTIEIPPDWLGLIKRDTEAARAEQLRVRREFEAAFQSGLVCRAFERDTEHPRYLLYRNA